MKKHTLTIAAALLATLPAFGARAAVPELIPVQGVLSDGGGEFVEGITSMVFSIYDSETAATALWTETQAVAVDRGFFTAYLGDLEPLPVEVLGAAGELWLGVTVGADPEMDRMQLASVPFALFCENAVGDITPATISVGGNLVVNADGEWVGPGMYAAGAGLTLTGFQFAANIGTAAGTVAAGDHAHDYSAVYAPVGHDHDYSGLYAPIDHAHAEYALVDHNHDAAYAPISHDHDGDYMAMVTCAAGMVLKATATGWDCADDADTTYTAGDGLSLTGTVFAANFGTTAATVAAGDHGHDEFADFAQFEETISAIDGCAAGQVLKWDGTGWGCSADEDTDTIYTAGTGLALTGTQFAADIGTAAGTIAAGDHLHEGIYAPPTHTHATLSPGAGLTGASYDGSAATTWAVSFDGTGSATTSARSDHEHDAEYAYIGHAHDAAYWGTDGNAGTVDGTHYLGTSDDVAFDLRVNNTRALRMEPHAESPNLVLGYSGNFAAAGVYGATIGGGGQATRLNRVWDSLGTVSGGSGNQAGGNTGNTFDQNHATVSGGINNTASGSYSTVGGGTSNTASGYNSTVVGGYTNTASGEISTVAGGVYNVASGFRATVGGGDHNTAAGSYSFAAGQNAKANNQGCFVWGDSTGADVSCSVDNRWVARASGGVYFYTNSTVTTGVYVAAGGGSWASVSDREKKKDIEEVDAAEVLEKVAGMPVSTWRYRTEESAALHMGPMAQDFHAAFGLGDSDKSITTIDAGGVALAAIKGLNEKLEEENAALKRRIAALESTNQDLAALSGRLEERLDRLDNGGRSRLAAASPWMLLGLLGLGGVFLVRSRRG